MISRQVFRVADIAAQQAEQLFLEARQPRGEHGNLRE